MSEKKNYLKKGNRIYSNMTPYQGEIEEEKQDYFVIKYFFNPRSGHGYKHHIILKSEVGVE